MVGGVALILVLIGCAAPGDGAADVPSEETKAADTESSAAVEAPGGETAVPFLRVLGTAQDGGFPHAACEHPLCRRAREEPALRSHVASLALIVSGAEKGREVFLIDATPDIRAQLDGLRDVRALPADRVDRAPVDGVMLTHAHLGHYTGLAFFGFEAVHTRDLPVFVTPRMATFLRENQPWKQLVSLRNITLVEQPPASRFVLGVGEAPVEVRMLQVPHRDELSDTVGFVLAGPNRTALYVPDTDSWAEWETPLLDVLEREGIDVAILDASFYSLDELPGRDVASIRHPLVTQSMDLLAPWVEAGGQVIFSHLNHSNPALDPASDARAAIEARGFRVAYDGQEISL